MMYYVAAAAIGATLGMLFCVAVSYRKNSTAPMGVMDKILVFEGVFLLVFIVVCLVMFWHTGDEPNTLITATFGICGVENGVMGWIKSSKDKTASTTVNAAALPANEMEDKQEPTDVGI